MDGFGHITSTPTTRRITDSDNIVFTAQSSVTAMEISVPLASTTTRGAARFDPNDFSVSGGVVTIGTNDVNLTQMQQIGNNTILANNTDSTGNIQVTSHLPLLLGV